MKQLPTDADGNSLQQIDHYPDGGNKVPDRIVEKAGILGALRLLEEIARRDENPDYRRQARHNADELKRLVRRAARTGGLVVSDAEILQLFEEWIHNVKPLLEERSQARAQQQRLPPATLVIGEIEHRFSDHQHCLKCGKSETLPDANDCTLTDHDYEAMVQRGEEPAWRRE